MPARAAPPARQLRRIERDPSAGIKNPKRKRAERRDVYPFESWDELESIADELDARYAAIPIFATATGLRPEEWIALHRSDIDKQAKVVTVRRRYSGRQLKPGSKTGTERIVPLTTRALEAVESMEHRCRHPDADARASDGHVDRAA